MHFAKTALAEHFIHVAKAAMAYSILFTAAKAALAYSILFILQKLPWPSISCILQKLPWPSILFMLQKLPWPSILCILQKLPWPLAFYSQLQKLHWPSILFILFMVMPLSSGHVETQRRKGQDFFYSSCVSQHLSNLKPTKEKI